MGEQQTAPAWRDENLTILIPMAGAGSRFQQAELGLIQTRITIKRQSYQPCIAQITSRTRKHGQRGRRS